MKLAPWRVVTLGIILLTASILTVSVIVVLGKHGHGTAPRVVDVPFWGPRLADFPAVGAVEYVYWMPHRGWHFTISGTTTLEALKAYSDKYNMSFYDEWYKEDLSKIIPKFADPSRFTTLFGEEDAYLYGANRAGILHMRYRYKDGRFLAFFGL